jgi:RES domain-containing protein
MGMIRVWRICHRRYADTAFSGEGARLFGGRFNSEGMPAVYTSGALSLALLELLVQSNDRDYYSACVVIYAEIPDALIKQVDSTEMPNGWDRIPYTSVSQKTGDRWLKSGEAVAYQIPSVVVPVEYNFMINPLHPEFKKIRISKPQGLLVDGRLFDFRT